MTTIDGHEIAQKLGMDRYVVICASRNIEIKATFDDLLLRLKEKKVQNRNQNDSISLGSGMNRASESNQNLPKFKES